uniref:Intracellular protease/amidase n=1 Tax=Candidatus Kentrum sp. MB TaxID=2138164 RepID=A0A450XYT3_9GAMM|nr:MAG: Putative intracellular protease/amidase [Candidatus Kentron sp. MB]VFK76764.1 MAG: Putative intracellular protease/amidase [Candidatus Kentron sp. MB]
MAAKSLSGKKIAVLVESEFVPSEIRTYQERFASYGAEVHLMSRLWGNKKLTFISDVQEAGKTPETLDVEIDFTQVDMDDYAAVIMAANYTSVRLRWIDDVDVGNGPVHGDSGRRSPAVQFFYRAMMNPKIVKGFPCHGLWILSPIPEMLAGRRVTCNRVMLGDVRNAGGIYIEAENGVVVDADMVTNDSASHSAELVDAICDQIIAIESGKLIPAISASTTPSAFSSEERVVANPKKRRILMLISEWGYWGEELIGPLEEFDRVGYETEFCTPTGKRPNAVLVSMLPEYIDPPLGRSVTSPAMADKVKILDDPATELGKRLDNPKSLADWFPERPYWADPQFVRFMELYNQRLVIAEKEIEKYDAVILVGGSGPVVDMVNNQRVHDLILAFYRAGKPIAAECYGVACLAFARNIENKESIIRGKRVTGHCLEYDYKDGTAFMKTRGEFLDFNMGPPPYPLEYILRDATGPHGAYIGNFGHPTSVIVDYPFVTGRSTPDSYLTGRKLIEVLDGDPPLRRWGW